MSYQALYRKWRPQTFDDVCGQRHITDTIKNQVLNDRVSHAYLFCGPRGTGKTSTARILSRAINCTDSVDGNPCNKCANCENILGGRIVDVVEIDAASNNSVENIRQIRDTSAFVAGDQVKRVYIIDEVHMLSSSAFNAFLKLLEEPPKDCYFILATTEGHKLPKTIPSRCQRFDFRRISQNDIITQLKQILNWENAACEDSALFLLAQKAEGGMRDAISLLDQCLSAYGNQLTYEAVCGFFGMFNRDLLRDTVLALGKCNPVSALLSSAQVCDGGASYVQLMESLLEFLRDLMFKHALSQNDNEKDELCQLLTYERIIYLMKTISDTIADARLFANAKTAWEISVFKMCSPSYQQGLDAVLARLSTLEQGITARATELPTVTPTKTQETVAPNPPTAAQDAPQTAAKKTALSQSEKELSLRLPEIMSALYNAGKFALASILELAGNAVEEQNGRYFFTLSEDAYNTFKKSFADDKEFLEQCIQQVTGIQAEVAVKPAQQQVYDNLSELADFSSES